MKIHENTLSQRRLEKHNLYFKLILHLDWLMKILVQCREKWIARIKMTPITRVALDLQVSLKIMQNQRFNGINDQIHQTQVSAIRAAKKQIKGNWQKSWLTTIIIIVDRHSCHLIAKIIWCPIKEGHFQIKVETID